MKYRCYDIESLRNLFTLSVYADDGAASMLEVYYIADGLELASHEDEMRSVILARNANLAVDPRNILFFDLGDVACFARMANEFGLCLEGLDGITLTQHVGPSNHYTDGLGHVDQARPIPQPRQAQVCRLRADTDPGFDIDNDYFLLGFNSRNYDMVMLAALASLTVLSTNPADGSCTSYVYSPCTAADMRHVNDELFSDRYISNMRNYLYTSTTGVRRGFDTPDARWYRGMERTGRNIDIARVGMDTHKAALKRLLGVLGYQILESDRLDSSSDVLTSQADVDELVAYNASDVVNALKLFRHPAFEGKFEVKSGLLDTYPDLIFDASHAVRRNRLYRDSTSSQLTARTLCPDGSLVDDRALSLMYPSAANARRAGRRRFDVLDRAKEFFDRTVGEFEPLPGEPPEAVEARRRYAHSMLDPIFAFYGSLRGRDFNCGKVQTDRREADRRAWDYMAEYNQTNSFYHNTMDGTYTTTLDENRRVADDIADEFANPDRLGVFGRAPVPGWDAFPELEPYEGPDAVPRSAGSHLGCVPYFDRYGRPNGSYALFSVGGIHGADYNSQLYLHECAEYDAFAADSDWLLRQLLHLPETAPLPDFDADPEACAPAALRLVRLSRRRTAPLPFLFPSGRPRYLRDFLRSGFTRKRAYWKPRGERPSLFVSDGGFDTKFNVRYVWTSVVTANHEDFKSYYPNMLDQMDAFKNASLDKNRYHEMFVLKEEYGRQKKLYPKGDPRVTLINIKRNGVKLQLNSGTGVGGAQFDNPVRMNNRILAMRVIGQLFSWQIGQTQASAGARIPSTNTDGLYTVMDESENNRLLAAASDDIGIIIEPEVLELVSKDANNRVEWSRGSDGKPHILSCGGGDLTHWQGPNPTKNLAHPAAVDWALARYLVAIAAGQGQDGFMRPFEPDTCRSIMDGLVAGDPNEALVMFGQIVSASPNVMSYPYATVVADGTVLRLGHYTRVYAVRPDADVSGRPIVSMAKAVGRKGMPVNGDRVAIGILASEGVSAEDLMRENRGPCCDSITGIPKTQACVVENRSVREMPPDQARALLDALDLDFYVGLVGDKWERNWRNVDVPAEGDA